jgi:plasmid maintenance system antidote protein VapI
VKKIEAILPGEILEEEFLKSLGITLNFGSGYKMNMKFV